PFCCGRWEYHRDQAGHMHEERDVPLPSWTAKPLGEYLSHLWLDTHTQDRHAMSLVMAEAGEHVIVLGGDHPYTPYEGGVPYAMDELRGLSPSATTTENIEHENALALLGERGRTAYKQAAT
ncbi:MAG TPA: hypothetical protein VKU60_16850, partial [Chloroflexota bacterium]|nr:hypothetical protein [Chloroflexota bacterium]